MPCGCQTTTSSALPAQQNNLNVAFEEKQEKKETKETIVKNSNNMMNNIPTDFKIPDLQKPGFLDSFGVKIPEIKRTDDTVVIPNKNNLRNSNMGNIMMGKAQPESFATIPTEMLSKFNINTNFQKQNQPSQPTKTNQNNGIPQFNIPNQGPKQPLHQIGKPTEAVYQAQKLVTDNFAKNAFFDFKNPVQQKTVFDPKTSLTVSAVVLQKDDPQIEEFARKAGIKLDDNSLQKNVPFIAPIQKNTQPPMEFKVDFTPETNQQTQQIHQAQPIQQVQQIQQKPALMKSSPSFQNQNMMSDSRIPQNNANRFTTHYMEFNGLAGEKDNKISTKTVKVKKDIRDASNDQEIRVKRMIDTNRDGKVPVINNTKNVPIFDSNPY